MNITNQAQALSAYQSEYVRLSPAAIGMGDAAAAAGSAAAAEEAVEEEAEEEAEAEAADATVRPVARSRNELEAVDKELRQL
jgi:hypothetical protein